jgi:hypothetical protein
MCKIMECNSGLTFGLLEAAISRYYFLGDYLPRLVYGMPGKSILCILYPL